MSVNMFADDLYATGSSIPEGDYALEFNVLIHQATKKDTGVPVGQARLGVMVKAYPVNEKGELIGEPREKFYGMGTNAHLSFAPDPDTGKGIVPIPNAKFSTLMGNTNFAMLRKSLVDCDPTIASLPDFSALDGIWVHLHNVPEPEERKSFTSKTSEVKMLGGEEKEEERKGPGVVGIISAILAKPWEGEGGIPTEEAVAAPVKKVAAKPAVKAPVKAAAPTVKAPVKKAAPVVEAEEGDDDMRVLAVSLISAQLEKNLAGMTRLKLRTEVFKSAGANANAVIGAAFKDDETLAGVLNGLGYGLDGANVVPQ